MAVGRISGPLLKSNLIRNGIDLAFETDLLYLDVNNQRIGVKTSSPAHELDVNGTTRTTDLIVTNQADIADVTISGNTISTTNPYLNLATLDTVVSLNRLRVDNVDIEGNAISTNASNADLEFRPNGTGTVNVHSDLNVDGNIHATGNISADGNITIGDADTDNITINAEVASDIIPDQAFTYTLGNASKVWQDVWVNTLYADTINSTDIDLGGVDLTLRHGNIFFVAENGDDTNSGDHIQDPFGSVKYALSQATAGDVIHIYPGVYVEEFPLTVPVGVSVVGQGLRGVMIKPTTETRYNDAFLLNGETTISDITVSGFYSGGNYFAATATPATNQITFNVGTAPFTHTYVSGGTFDVGESTQATVTNATYNNTTGELTLTLDADHGSHVGNKHFLSNLTFSCNGGTRVFPDNGYGFRFATDYEVTTRSPYIKNVTVITEGSSVAAATNTPDDPRGFNAGDAGKGAYIDGAYATANSKEAAMLFHSATFITPGVDAITATNGARIEWLNSFTYFANRSFYAYDSNDGLYGAGKTRIRLGGVSGTFAAGNTVTFTSTDSSTVVNVTVDSVDGDVILVDGKNTDLLDFDTTPASISNGAGATASSIENVDVRDFGAEIRMIGSASVYGNYGLVGDGPGVLVYAIGHNLAYIGNGKEVTNDPNTVVQANEVVELNDAQIRYNSVDHKGDFRVGDLFYVNQEDGTVSFNVSDFSIDTSSGVTFTTDGDTTYIDGTRIDTGNWRISGNTIETLAGDANFNSANGTINLQDNVNITGNLDVTGDVTIGGNITIGDDASDTIQIVAGIDSDIVPSQTSTYNLGTSTKTWKNLYINQINLDSIEIRDNYIQTVDSNANLELRANGTGEVLVPSNDVQIDNNLNVDGTTTLSDTVINGTLSITGDVGATGNYTISNDVTVNQNLTVGASAQFEEILIDDNYITTTSTNADLELRAAGTGEILVPTNDVNITNDLSVGGDIDANSLTTTGQITSNSFTTGDILIDNNVIETTLSNSDLELRASGTGNVTVPSNNVTFSQALTVSGDTDLQGTTVTGTIAQTGNVTQTGNFTIAGEFTNGNIEIQDNFITTTNSNSDLELRANGTGEILVPTNDVQIDNNLTVSGVTDLQATNVTGTITHVGNTTQTGNINLTGNLDVDGQVTISSTTQFEDIQVSGNVVTTTTTNSDLELRASGTGDVIVPNNDVTITNDLTVQGTITVGDINSAGTITANRFSTGDILIDDNFITTTTSNSNLELRANGTGEILIPSNDVQIDNDLTVSGDTNLQGTTITGTLVQTGNTTQTGNFNLTGNLDVSGNIDIAGAVQFENIRIAGNVLETTLSNSDLELRANGTGEVIIPNNDVAISNNLDIGGTLTVGNIVSTGLIQANNFTTGDILVDDNFITTTTSNSDLELRAAGTGSIIIDTFDINGNIIATSGDMVLDPGSEILKINATGALKLPVGSDLQRPTAASGQIRFNNTSNRFEGYNGTNWIQLHGVIDLDGDTKVTAELTEGANDNIIRFDVAGSTIVDVNSTRLNAPQITVDDIQIDGNVISTVTSNTDLKLTASGTGSVTFDNFAFKDNTITNTVAGSVTTFENTSTGYVKFSGTSGVVLPVGSTFERLPTAYVEKGLTRFNTDDSRVEIYDGTNWVSVAGSSSGISRQEAEDLALEIVLSLG